MNSMHLIGAEEVSRAACTMRDAASEMSRAASSIHDAFYQHQQFLNDWLDRLDGTLTDLITDLGGPKGPSA